MAADRSSVATTCEACGAQVLPSRKFCANGHVIESAAPLRHVDLLKKDWFNMREELQERIPEGDPRAEHAGYDGDYARYSELHTMEECPYG